MWGDQCQSCGGHENEIRFIAPCKFCSTKVCNGCRANHEGVCEEMTKRKALGAGPTVVAHPDAPGSLHSVGLANGVDFNIPPKQIAANLPAPTKVASQIPDETAPAAPGTINVDVDAVNAELAEAEANEAARRDAEAALLAATPLVEAVAQNPAVAALLDPLGLVAGHESPLTVGDVLTGGLSEADRAALDQQSQAEVTTPAEATAPETPAPAVEPGSTVETAIEDNDIPF